MLRQRPFFHRIRF